MKIDGTILGIETHGDKLSVKCQGLSPGMAEWRPYQSFTMEVPDTERHAKSLYVGRKISVTIKVR